MSRYLLLMSILWMSSFSGVASAALLTLEFSGLLTQGNGGLFQVDDPWSVKLFASNPSDDRDNGTNGSYRVDWTGSGVVSGQHFSIFSYDPVSGVNIRLGNPYISTISISVPLNNIVVFDGVQMNGFGVDLFDSPVSPTVTDDSFMAMLDFYRDDPVVGQVIFGFPSSGITQVVGDIRSAVITGVPVPVPSAFLLLVSAISVTYLFGSKASA